MTPPGPKWHSREDSGLVIDANVDWWHDGERIEHPNIIEAFNRGLRVGDDGQVRLEFGNDWCFVKVARAAFKVLAVDVSFGQRLSLRLSDRTAEWLETNTLSVDADGVVFAAVKAGRAQARFTRQAQGQLAPFLEQTSQGSTVQLRVGDAVWPTSIVVNL